ncbi:homoserine dehydrogenase [Tindallia magadiensis]|uniref:Homoserine dehydrogenase n=1 Tax=Tindallia magadiensis TaxID=69895 RepID=A0A1I3DPP5_9FIRM|nr:homoserine dehydrogenase [Tindallia magadiensis]SFH88705.1 homoserine dehydrogenase [Tindallia magadiensis]
MERIKIGLLGFGTVGQGVWKVLGKNHTVFEKQAGFTFEISKVLVNDIDKEREIRLDEGILTVDPEEILEDDSIHIVVELMGGTDGAKKYVEKALEKKKHVVTANKALLALYGKELTAIALKNGVQFRYEASVAGGIPILHSIRESLTANRIQRIMGIVNGTTNYILTKMSREGVRFEDALEEAQQKGYAEADPTADVDGYDAAHKLALLAALGFKSGIDFQQVYREGIRKMTPTDIEFAEELGFVVKLLAIGMEEDGKMELRVHPTFIEKEHPLAAVNDAFNAVFVEGNAVGELMFYGKGAGDLPTASAVIGDILSIASHWNHSSPPSYQLDFSETCKTIKSMDETQTAYYIRFMVKDSPGVLGRIASTFGENGVSLSSVIQKGVGETSVPLVFITHKTKEEAVKKTIQQIGEFDAVTEVANLIRVETLS